MRLTKRFGCKLAAFKLPSQMNKQSFTQIHERHLLPLNVSVRRHKKRIILSPEMTMHRVRDEYLLNENSLCLGIRQDKA